MQERLVEEGLWFQMRLSAQALVSLRVRPRPDATHCIQAAPLIFIRSLPGDQGI